MDNEIGLMRRKAQVFLERQTPVHITNKNDSWSNGFVKEVGRDFLILDEFKRGKEIIFFLEIIKFDTYTKEVKE